MDKSMNKRVYGILGISSLWANWNADFSGYPKSLSDGRVFGSDKALKYPMKKIWDNEGQKVLYIKSMKVTEGKKGESALVPRSLRERYEFLFGASDLKDVKEVLKNLMASVDVKNFGATFAEAGCNIAITGAVQIGQGFNKYEDTTSEEQQILSPFRDATATKKNKDNEDEEAKNSTLGTKIGSSEAHYFYPFVINPLAYKEMANLKDETGKDLEITEGYTDEDYQNFKRTALVSATAFATNSKIGCENEFAVFVETKIDTYLPNLSEYVEFEKQDDKNCIKIEKLVELLKEMADTIDSIEIYYNPYTTILEGDIKDAKYFNILTLKEV